MSPFDAEDLRARRRVTRELDRKRKGALLLVAAERLREPVRLLRGPIRERRLGSDPELEPEAFERRILRLDLTRP